MTENQTRLESWKEIAGYLQRDTTTAQRWEKEEGLPVHRHSHKRRSSVYAYPSEIDAWRAGRKVVAETAAAPRPAWRIPAFAVTLLLCLLMVGNGVRPVSAQGIQFRQLTAPDLDIFGSFTPNGRSMLITDWNKTGDLAILDVESGKMKRLFAKPGPATETYNMDTDETAESPIFSRDQKQIAYELCNNERHHDHCQFRIMANQPGAKSRTLLQDGTDFTALGWSKDARRILVNIEHITTAPQSQRPDKSHEIAWVSTLDGSITSIKSFGPRQRITSNLSPDDRYILYSVTDDAGSRDSSVYVIGGDGKGESVLAKNGSNEVPIWTPDGSYALFSSNRSGSFGLWTIPMRDGKATGPVRPVITDVGRISNMQFGSAGTLFYWQPPNQDDVISNVFIAEIDPGTGKVRGAPSMVAEGSAGLNFIGALSPDGKSVAILRSAGKGFAAQTGSVVIRSTLTGEEKVFEGPKATDAWINVFWTENSQGVLFPTRGQGQHWVLNRMDASTGAMSVVIQADIVDYAAIAVPASDLGTLYFTDFQGADRKALGIFAIDIVTGKRRTVFQSSETVSDRVLSLSPDGRTLAFLQGPGGSEKLCSVSVDGTGFREIYQPGHGPEFSARRTLGWSHDSRSIFFGLDPPTGDPMLMRVSASGGEPEFTGLAMNIMHHVYAGADGAHIVFGVRADAKPTFWLLDNLLPTLKRAR